jgi:hypothetical protein
MTDISELFTRDPEKLTVEDRQAIIAKYREARHQFVLGVKQAGNAKRIKAEVPKIKDLSLDDLDI